MINQPLAGYRILIVEDEYLIAMDVEQLCLEHGASETLLQRDITTEGDPVNFDVAVLDVMVDGQLSLDFARTLRARNIPFVFATGYSGTHESFGDFPGVPIVGKPYAAAELIDAIVTAVRRGRPSADVAAEDLGSD